MNPARSYLTESIDGRTGVLSWLLTTDHKRIGVLYMALVFAWFSAAVLMGMLLRTELMTAGRTIMGAETYNALFTLHGVIMVFLFIIPGMPAIFGNFLLPLQIGANDVFFPRLNLLSWYLYLLGGIIAMVSLFIQGAPDTGWTFYVPFSVTTQTGVTLTVFAVFVLGVSSMITAINFITTTHRMRAKGMGWMQIPLFTWAIYATSWVQLLATPIIGITMLILIAERLVGAGFFDPARGGDPLLFQHLFWMYSHPAVYVMILPGMGIISEIFPVFSRKSIFGYKAIVVATLGIAIVGSLVWAHHMFTSGMSDTAVLVFSFLTYMVAIPSAVKVFNWVSTMYRGSVEMSPPLLLSLCFVYLFSVGGITGLVLGAAGPNVHVHDTHFVVAHFHFVMFGGAGFAFLAGLHFWWPKIFGRMYSFRRAYIGIILLTMGFILHYTPMFILGIQGMPRRYYDYLPVLEPLNFFSGFGAAIMVIGIFLILINLILGLRSGDPAPPDPWGGTTLEWSIPSPPPAENFESEPEVLSYPYDFPEKKRKAEGGS
ncbi:MAG: cytochrome c oxidase subunit I [Candidatus Melainabacteria bacterium HGW-Melainabacteria-1]|nr:MAG: cytochrome c oxidase subunit I [Candidatus Melainabacteria bacterium HGW-Melainabacteria-1]